MAAENSTLSDINDAKPKAEMAGDRLHSLLSPLCDIDALLHCAAETLFYSADDEESAEAARRTIEAARKQLSVIRNRIDEEALAASI
jgi:hypothetical protein